MTAESAFRNADRGGRVSFMQGRKAPPMATPAGGEPVHVCFVSMSIYPMLVGSTDVEFAGGGEMQQVMLARMLHSDGFRVSVLTADHGQPDVVDSDGIQIFRMPEPARRGVPGLRFLHPLCTDIVKSLDRVDSDIVYFRVAGFRAAAVAWYAKTRGKRFIYASGSDREFQGRDVTGLPRRDQVLFRLAVRSADAVLVQNLRQQELLKKNFDREASLVPNCYAEAPLVPGSPNGPILWVGTFKPVKHPELFVDLARRFPTRRFVVVGGADHRNDPGQSYYGQMRQLAATVPNIEFVGYVPFQKVGSYFDGSSILVNTSDSEGFPNTFLRAWIRGIPTLSFVSPEIAAGDSGTIKCSNLDDMAERLSALLSDSTVWRAASNVCHAHFEKDHSVSAVLQRYRDVLGQWSIRFAGQ